MSGVVKHYEEEDVSMMFLGCEADVSLFKHLKGVFLYRSGLGWFNADHLLDSSW